MTGATELRRRLLFLAPVVPADRGNGLAMRVGFFLDAYSRVFDVDVAVFPVVSAAGGGIEFARRRARRIEIFAHPGVDSHLGLVQALKDPPARLAAFRRYGRPSLAGFVEATAWCALDAWTGGGYYDVMHVSRLYLAGLAHGWARRQPVPPRLVIDCDEDDAAAHRRIAAVERTQGRLQQAAWDEAEADAFAHLSRNALPHFDLAFAASANEIKSMSAWSGKTMEVPNVAARPMLHHRRGSRTAHKTVLFVGTMGYAPNDDGVRWFLTRVWPRLRLAVRSPVRLVVVGSNPAASLVRLGRRRDVTVTGAVPDVGRFYRRADLAVIPIHAGGGTRIKLMEAAAWQVPVVSTGFGADGTAFRHDRELLIANNAEQFARACAALLRNRARAGRLATAARRRVALDYDAERWARRVVRRVAALNCGDGDWCE